MRRATAVLVLLFAFPLTAATTWLTDPAAALEAARREKKLLLIHYRSASEAANRNADAMIEKALGEEVTRRTLESYVALRFTDQPPPQHPMFDELARRYKGPAIAIYDHAGIQLLVLEKLHLGWTPVGEELLRFRTVRNSVVRAAEHRIAGDEPMADFGLGTVFFNAGHAEPAAKRFDLASDGFRKNGKKDLHHLAELYAGTAWYSAGPKWRSRGRVQVANVLREPLPDAIAAEAWYARGKIDQADRNTASAIKSLRKAYELAAPGSQTLEQIRLALAEMDDQPLPPKGAAKSAMRIVPPARQTVTGDADFLVETSGAVARVDFFLDDVKVATKDRLPFRATIDVGPTPRARNVKAIAFDANGKAAGEAVVTINDRADAFRVSVVAPASPFIAEKADVEVAVHVPPSRRVRHVELYWNDQKLAVLTKPPYRHAVTANGAFGYVRAVGVLDDGTTAEETRIYNAAGMSESVEVGAVTLIASVLDTNGDRVAGLQSRDFIVEDDGKRVQATLRSSDDEPVTIGIAIDSSSSMIGKQLYVVTAAAEFLARAVRKNDEAFVVSFDSSARLVHRRTNDVASLRAAVFSLVPVGGTSIYDGVTFALQQFQGISGKKALIVFSDGREGMSSASARECERLARTVGVPVYLVVPPGGERFGHALKGIAAITGGAMLHAPSDDELPRVIDRLADELRGLYVLSFVRPDDVKPGAWRPLKVAVKRSGATVRTVEGYRAN